MMSDLQHLLLSAVDYFRSYTAWIAFIAAFGETLIGLGFFIPGSTLLLFMGVLAGQGYIDIKTVLLFGLAGAYAGDLVNYRLGRRHGAALLQKPWLHLPEEALEKSRKFLNTHGAKSLFFARFIPGLKESVSFLAGSMKMDRGKFLFWDFLGAVGWSLEFIGIGFLFSTSLALAQLWLSRTVTTIAVFTFLLFLLYLLKRFVVQNGPAAKTVLSALRHAFLTAGPVKRFSASHPKLTLFLRRRIDSSVFTGLPLTLFAPALLYLLALFGGTVEDILTKDPIVYADSIVANLIVQWRTPELTPFFTWITYLGKVEVLLAFLAAATLILLLNRRYEQIVALYFSIAGSALSVYLGKLALHRPRPETALYFEPTYSFPSAHAAAAVAFYGFLAYLLMWERKSFKSRINILFTVTVLILLIGFSRIYLGVHYLSDVFGGYLAGTLWLIAAAALLHRLLYKKAPGRRAPFRYAKPVGYLALFAAAAFYLIFGTHYHYKPMTKGEPSVGRVENQMRIFDNSGNRFAILFLCNFTQKARRTVLGRV
ncbi:membrane-associated phospholipid phosphatase [Hydrogenimonas sp.]|nr:membrane-associated phospholipid phosphatase [Hydrogenimonas sp.]